MVSEQQSSKYTLRNVKCFVCMCCSCVLGVGFAGVVEVKRGADDVTDALRDVNETMHRVRKQVL